MEFLEHFATSLSSLWLSKVLAEIEGVCRHRETQWMVVLCLALWFVALLFLERLVSHGRSHCRWQDLDWSLSAMLALTLSGYAIDYESASRAQEILVLFAGIVFGKAAALWVRRSGNERRSFRRIYLVISMLAFFLALAALWQPSAGVRVRYRSVCRWTGVWDSPNIFGMLMGVGFILAMGQLVSGARCWVSDSSWVERRVRSAGLWRRLQIVFLLVAAVVMSVGLVKSYSRGAWVATAVGLVYLAWNALKCQVSSVRCQEEDFKAPQPMGGGRDYFSRGSCGPRLMSFLYRNLIPLASILVALFVIMFWQYRHTESVIVRRAFSVGNVNDFSWRNRILAWEGALQMIPDRPWCGFGWDRLQSAYDSYYRPAKTVEGMAIQLNDYFMLRMTLGLPALACFAAYIGIALSPKSVAQSPASKNMSLATYHLSPQMICRAGAVVLLVGFWFDGGLFKLATGATFWILLELGKDD
jgi:O-antigen ligase